MSDNKLAVIEEKIELERKQLKAEGQEVRALVPGGDKLSDNQAVALAKYAKLTDANLFRGEVYGYQGRNGQLQMVDGYKLLIRWAKNISNYDETYTKVEGAEGVTADDIAYQCQIVRHDKREQLRFYIDCGATLKESIEQVGSTAIGVVTKSEMWSSKWNKAIDPPSGWTWDQVARKRALKNALNMAFEMPSPKQIVEESWRVEGVETVPDDWRNADHYNTAAERERSAMLEARHRQAQERREAMTEQERQEDRANIAAATALMRNNGDDIDPVEEAEAIEGDFTQDEPEAELNSDNLDAIISELRQGEQTNRQGDASSAQYGLIRGKLEECFAGQGDERQKANTVVCYIYGDDGKITFGQAKAILSWLIDHKDDDTGDYVLNHQSADIVRQIYRIAQVENGQLCFSLDIDDQPNGAYDN